jgi:lipoate-protein ligase A
MEVLSGALKVSGDKIESKGIKSVSSRVTNIRPYMQTDKSTGEFWAALREYMFAAFDMREYTLSPQENAAVEELQAQVYSQWSWNYGASPPYNLRKTRRIDGCGKFEILLDVEKAGLIKNITFYGDFFGRDDPEELAAVLISRRLEYNELKAALRGIDISRYFHNLTPDQLLSLLLE